MSEITELKREIKTLASMVRQLVSKEARKKTWVRATVITDLTGWNGEKLRQAREYCYIKFEKRSDGIWYLLESLPEQLIRKYVADTVQQKPRYKAKEDKANDQTEEA